MRSLSFALNLLLVVPFYFACGGSSEPDTFADADTQDSASGDSGVSEDAPAESTRPAWSLGNAADEEAYCKQFAEVGAITSASKDGATCTPEPGLYSARLGSCAKFIPCQRSGMEPDFIERVRVCNERKLANCDNTGSCENEAGASYPGGASIRLACAGKQSSCRDNGIKLDLGCETFGATKSSLLTKVEKCFAGSYPCADVRQCFLAAYGTACSGLK